MLLFIMELTLDPGLERVFEKEGLEKEDIRGRVKYFLGIIDYSSIGSAELQHQGNCRVDEVPDELVETIYEDIYSNFDRIVQLHGIEDPRLD